MNWFTKRALPCRAIERQVVWADVACRFWLSAKDAEVRVSDDVTPGGQVG